MYFFVVYIVVFDNDLHESELGELCMTVFLHCYIVSFGKINLKVKVGLITPSEMWILNGCTFDKRSR